MKKYPVPGPPTLLQRKHETVREAIGDQASRLFLEQGFDATTIEDIAQAAGIGRRTFFRYFRTKEDVVLWKFDQFARRAVELIATRPARESAFVALQHALIEAAEFYNQEPAQTLAVLKLTLDTPPLYAQALLQQDRWKCWFAEALRRRLRASARSLLPELAAAVGLEAFTLAVRRWVASPRSELGALIGSCFGALQDVVRGRGAR